MNPFTSPSTVYPIETTLGSNVVVPTFDLLMLLKNLQLNIAFVAESYGLTISQLYTMHAIAEEHRTMGQMAQAMSCDASNVTGIIDKLVTMGLVTRQEDPKDRRIKTVQLTADGEKTLQRIMDAMPGRTGPSRLTQREVDELYRVLRKVNSSFPNCYQK